MKAGFFTAIVTVTSLALAAPSWAAEVGITEITAASYGYAGERAKIPEIVMKLCGGKTSCRFMVTPETFGVPDPSPGNDKGLIIGWKCAGSGTVHRDQLPGGKSAELKCP